VRTIDGDDFYDGRDTSAARGLPEKTPADRFSSGMQLARQTPRLGAIRGYGLPLAEIMRGL
jgi:hypothetical protein